MIITSSSYQGPKEIDYLFIDGAYFERSVKTIGKNFFGLEHFPTDYSKLSSGFAKTFYYDCLPLQKEGENHDDYHIRIKPKINFFSELRLLNGFHVYEGITTGSEGRIRQKQVDIMIAVDMLTHAFNRNMHRATLLTGDLDFKPLIDALVQNGMYVTLWYDPTNTNKELIYASDAKRKLDVSTVHGLADDQFQAQFKIPSAHAQREMSVTGWVVMKSGTTEYGQKITLYQKDNQYLIVYREHRGPRYFIYIEYKDLDFLEKFVTSTHCNFSWEA